MKELKRFNDAVIGWNKSTPDATLEFIREEYAEQIELNKNKKRVTRNVMTYE